MSQLPLRKIFPKECLVHGTLYYYYCPFHNDSMTVCATLKEDKSIILALAAYTTLVDPELDLVGSLNCIETKYTLKHPITLDEFLNALIDVCNLAASYYFVRRLRHLRKLEMVALPPDGS